MDGVVMHPCRQINRWCHVEREAPGVSAQRGTGDKHGHLLFQRDKRTSTETPAEFSCLRVQQTGPLPGWSSEIRWASTRLLQWLESCSLKAWPACDTPSAQGSRETVEHTNRFALSKATRVQQQGRRPLSVASAAPHNRRTRLQAASLTGRVFFSL